MLSKCPLILLYHKIKEPDLNSTLCVRPNDFKLQIKYLLENNFRIVSLYDIINELPQRKTVAITFDDGYANNYLNAYPHLLEFKIPATIFMVAGLTGQKSIWDEKNGRPSDELLSWLQVREMAQNNISIGSHSFCHDYLTKIKWWPNIWRQVKHSKKIIEREIGKKILFFSYPFGRSNRLIRQMVKAAGYEAACGTALPNGKRVDIYNLPRLEVNTSVGPIDKFSELIRKHLN